MPARITKLDLGLITLSDNKDAHDEITFYIVKGNVTLYQMVIKGTEEWDPHTVRHAEFDFGSGQELNTASHTLRVRKSGESRWHMAIYAEGYSAEHNQWVRVLRAPVPTWLGGITPSVDFDLE